MWEDNGLYYKLDNMSQDKSFDSSLETIINNIMNK